jgi:hypothetical protein
MNDLLISDTVNYLYSTSTIEYWSPSNVMRKVIDKFILANLLSALKVFPYPLNIIGSKLNINQQSAIDSTRNNYQKYLVSVLFYIISTEGLIAQGIVSIYNEFLCILIIFFLPTMIK